MGLLLDLGYLSAALLGLPWFIYRVTVRGDWRSIPMRLGIGLPPPAAGCIWLHGSSAGEISLLRPLIRRFEKDFPEAPIVISAYSSTGFAAAKKVYPEHRVTFFPFDLSFVVQRFLRRFDPRLVVVVESDFWPNFLIATHAREIPVTVVNGKMSNRSYQLHARTRLVPWLLRSVPVIAAQSAEHASRFTRLGIPPEQVRVTGNMKYDLAVSADQEETATGLRRALGYAPGDTVVIGGSLHDRENEIVIESFLSLASSDAPVALILVPRYPTDTQRVQDLLHGKGVVAVRKTEIDTGEKRAPGRGGVLLVDTVGELKSLYGVADIAFVGGSLFYRGSNKGGHNLIEPAVLGVPVLFGPYNFSFKDTVQDLLQQGAGIEVADGRELTAALELLLTDESKREEMGRRARDVIVRSRGASDTNYELLTPYLETMKERPGLARFPIWSVVVYFLVPYALFNLIRRGIRYPAYWHRWPERFGYGVSFRDQKSLWIHAVSVGEVRTASQLVKALAERYPDRRILITTTTPTGAKQVRDLFGDRVSHSYVPYDLPAAVRRFMDRVDPEFAVVAETEFWPNLFGECRKRGIPLLLVNVRISPASLRRYKRVPVATHAMLSNADVLCAQTKTDARQLENLGISRHLIHVTGNLKFDAPVPESLLRGGEQLRTDWGRDRFVLIAASTHRGEEQRVLAAFRQLRSTYPDILLVLVPRHPERFGSVARRCVRAGFAVARRSQLTGGLEPDVDVLVGDTMGELQMFYVASDVAFIGGSLVSVGGHNLLEACAVGVPVIFGPHMFHIEEVSGMALERGAARQITDVAGLVDVVSLYVEQPALREKAGHAARTLVADNRGALDRTLKLVDDTLADLRGDDATTEERSG